MIYFKLYLISWLQFYRYVTFQEFVWNGYVLSVIVFLASVLQHSFFQNHHFIVIREGIRLRSAIQVRQTLVNECLTTPPAQNNILANWCWRWVWGKYVETNKVEKEHYLIRQDNIIYKFAIKLSFSSIGHDKSKLQKQISKLLILIETAAWQKKVVKSLFVSILFTLLAVVLVLGPWKSVIKNNTSQIFIKQCK